MEFLFGPITVNVLERLRLLGKPRNQGSSIPTGTLWPCDEFSVGSRNVAADSRVDMSEFTLVPYGTNPDGSPSGEGAQAPPLDLRDVSKSHKPRKRRGAKGITSYGKKMLKSAGSEINRLFPQHRVTLGTLTIPPLTRQQRIQMVEQWPQFVRQLIQRLSRRLKARGLPEVVALCSEVQPERLKESGQAYLHLHVLWLNQPGKKGNWTIHPRGLAVWTSKFWSPRLGLDPSSYFNVDVKRVRGQAARYLAKYLSKGSDDIAAASEDWGEGVGLKTWWNLSQAARKMVKDAVLSGDAVGALLDSVLQYAFANSIDECFAYLRHADIEYDGKFLTMG